MRAYPSREELGIFFLDISDRKAKEQEQAALQQQSERVELALDSGAIVGTWVWDVPQDRFTVDERFARSFSLAPEQGREGIPLSVVVQAIHPEDWPRVEKAIAEVLERGGPYSVEYRVRQFGGEYRWIEANGRVELDGEGRALRFPGVLIDIDRRKNVEANLRQSENKLRLALEASRLGTWTWEIASDSLTYDDQFARIFGLAEGEAGSWTALKQQKLLPEDAGRADAALRAALERTSQYDVEYRVRLASGSVRWVRATSEVIWSDDETRRPLRMVGTAQDITEAKELHDQLRRSFETFHNVIQNNPFGVTSLTPISV